MAKSRFSAVVAALVAGVLCVVVVALVQWRMYVAALDSDQTDSVQTAPRRFGISPDSGVAAILATQGATVVMADGTAQTGVVTGTAVTFSLVNSAPYRLAWSLATPAGSKSALSTTTGSTTIATPDVAGLYNVTLQAYSEAGALSATYLMTLLVTRVSPTVYVGPPNVPQFEPSEVPTPVAGQTLFVDKSNGYALSVKNRNGVVSALGSDNATKIRDTTVDPQSPTEGQVLSYAADAGVAKWTTASGDVTGSLDALTVAKLRGVTVSDASPAIGQLLSYSDAGAWTPINPPSTEPTGTAAGDLCGTYPSPSVCKGGTSNLTALRAVSTVALKNREIRVVGTAGADIGSDQTWQYRTDVGSGAADDGYLVIKPDDVLLAANGRWLNAEAVPTIPTVAALQSLTSTFHKRVRVLGYESENDGGGGEFVFRGATGVADDGLVFSAIGGNWHRIFDGPINVRWYGVLPGAAAADNTTRINEMFVRYATTAGTRYYIPEGTYSFNDEVLITYQTGVTIEGAGQDRTTLRYTGTANTDKAACRFMYAVRNAVRGITCDANSLAGYGILLSAYDSAGSLVGGAFNNTFDQVGGKGAVGTTGAGLAIGQRKDGIVEVNLDQNEVRSGSTFYGAAAGVSLNYTNTNWTKLDHIVAVGNGAAGTVQAGIEIARGASTTTIRGCGTLVPSCVYDVADPWKATQCANIVVRRNFGATLRIEDMVLELRPDTGMAPALYVERISGGTVALGNIVISGLSTRYNCHGESDPCLPGDTLWPIIASGGAGTVTISNSELRGAGTPPDAGTPLATPVTFDSSTGGGGPTRGTRLVIAEGVHLTNGAYWDVKYDTNATVPMRFIDLGTVTNADEALASTMGDMTLIGTGQRLVAPGHVLFPSVTGVTLPVQGINSNTYKFVIDKAALKAAATTQELYVATFPVGYPVRVTQVVTNVTEVFGGAGADGGAVSGITLQVGVSGGTRSGLDTWVLEHDVQTGPAPIVRGLVLGAGTVANAGIGPSLDPGDAGYFPGYDIQGLNAVGASQMRVVFKSSAGNFGDGSATSLTTGSAEIFLRLEPMQ